MPHSSWHTQRAQKNVNMTTEEGLKLDVQTQGRIPGADLGFRKGDHMYRVCGVRFAERKSVNFGWLLPRVLLAEGVRVAQAGRPGRRDHVSPGSFAPTLGWEEHVQADKPWYNYYIAV